ncbi:MAG: hypothetical protein SH850_22590 [Planctomycetaceae bacterium]|nr:hypothetical protein [Planctomycetaceae bacterium]
MLACMTDSSNPLMYWFPAKRYGWGWGPPNSWHGWAVLAGFVLSIVIGALIFPPQRWLGQYLAWTTVCTAQLIAICWHKGEPPRWRWGENKP